MKPRLLSSLDWLDTRGPGQFLAVLYIARWLLLLPVLLWGILFPGGVNAAGLRLAVNQNPLVAFVGFLFLAPALETLVECVLPYLAIARLSRGAWRLPPRAWSFIALSALLMALLHPIPSALVPSFITGAFLAYCFAHFATQSLRLAFLATAGFHAAINLVGWSLLFLGIG